MVKPMAFGEDARRALERGMDQAAGSVEGTGGLHPGATATVLAQAMVSEGLRRVDQRTSPAALKSGMEKAAEAITAQLLAAARPIDDKQEIVAVAVRAASGGRPPGSQTDPPEDPEDDAEAATIGALVAEAFDRLGKDAPIVVESAATAGLTLELTEGMRLDRGYLSPYFADRGQTAVVLAAPAILVVDSRLTSGQALLPLVEMVRLLGKPLLIVAEDVDGEALSTLVVNNIRGRFSSVAVRAPGVGGRRRAILGDLAVLTGGQVISGELASRLDDVGPDMLGAARKVVVTRDDTTIVDGAGEPLRIAARIKEISAEIDNTASDFDREKLLERLARLSAGVAVITAGAPTEVGLKQRMLSIDNAIRAATAALDEGVVAVDDAALHGMTEAAFERLEVTGDEAMGADIVRAAVEVSTRDRALEPVAFTRSALQTAVSVAAEILTTPAGAGEAISWQRPGTVADPGGGADAGMDY